MWTIQEVLSELRELGYNPVVIDVYPYSGGETYTILSYPDAAVWNKGYWRADVSFSHSGKPHQVSHDYSDVNGNICFYGQTPTEIALAIHKAGEYIA